MNTQKIATRVFMIASVVFGIVGLAIIFTGGPSSHDDLMGMILARTLFTSVVIILTSFALSVATKYLQK
ncbi:MAG TPA: hypothetical protein VF438_04070 [Candidatus Paceibacterota bacterium]